MNARERWAAEELALLRAALPRTVKVDAEESREIAGWKRIKLGLDDGSVVELEATANDEGFAAIDVVAFAGPLDDPRSLLDKLEGMPVGHQHNSFVIGSVTGRERDGLYGSANLHPCEEEALRRVMSGCAAWQRRVRTPRTPTS